MRDFFSNLGIKALRGIYDLGCISILFVKVLKIVIMTPPRRNNIIIQMYQIGVLSLPVVLITGAFTGMVLAVQSFYQFHQISLETAVGILVGLSMTNELGPVLTALMVTGRVGASMTAELGTMNVTEQIDALRSLATNPLQYLIAPRIIACIALLPLLTICSVFIGIVGGYTVGVKMLGINATFFAKNLLHYTEVSDLMTGLIKSVYFGVIIAFVSCYKGFTTSGGAEGVGKATTQTVVIASITILIVDFFLSLIL